MKQVNQKSGTSEDPLDHFNDTCYPQGIGQRLSIFRKVIGLSREKMAKELHIETMDLQNLENGKIDEEVYYPVIALLHKEYGLDANWITSGHGFIFSKKGPKTPAEIYQFLQWFQNQDRTGLFLDMIFYKIFPTSLSEKLVDFSAFKKYPLEPSRQSEYH